MVAATSRRGPLPGIGGGVAALLLADPLQRPLDGGHGLGRVDEGDGLQGEAVCQKAGEDVRARRAPASGSWPNSRGFGAGCRWTCEPL